MGFAAEAGLSLGGGKGAFCPQKACNTPSAGYGFPRNEGWGWILPKMYAFAKMPHNMLKFGSANIFSGITQKKHKGKQIN